MTTTLEHRLNQQKNRIGLVGGRLKIVAASDAKEPIAAHIDHSDWHVEITVKKGYEPVRDKRTQSYVKKRNMKNPLEKICEDVLYHECGHWELPRGTGRGCPYDEPHHDSIVERISQVLKRSGKESFAKYVANAFEDVLVNTNCKQYTNHSGQILFWNEQGMTHGEFNKFYEAFVRLNLVLWGEKVDSEFIKRWYTNDKQAAKAPSEIMRLWNIQRKSLIRDKVGQLYQKEHWETLAEQFAQVMAPLIEEPQDHQLFGAASQAPGSSQSEGERDGSVFDKKLDTREGEEKAAHARYLGGKGPATNRDSFEQLDALYRRLARDVPVEIDRFTQAYSFPLVPWGKQPFDPEQHDLLQHKAKIGLQDDGSVGLMVNKGWIDTNEVYKRNIRKFPKFRLAVLDTSDSMRLPPDNSGNVGSKAFVPWGDNSKYHYALLGYYGIERFLQAQHIAPYVDSGAVNFSAKTQVAQGEMARKLLLTPQFGGTVLDVNVLNEQVKDADIFFLSISDGAIQNWNGIKDQYKSLVTRCAAAHIQIGERNQFSEDLESWGIPVYHVQGNKDLTKLMVKVTSERYKGYGKVKP